MTLAAGPIQWGDAPTWVAAVWTAIAAIGTVGTLIYVARQWGRDSKDRRSAQASQVSAIALQFSYPMGPRVTGPQQQPTDVCTAIVKNSSPAPIYDVSIGLMAWDWKKSDRKIDGSMFSTILGGDQSAPDDLGPTEVPSPPLTRPSSINPPLRVEFTDNSGVRWRRDPDGTLTELPKR